MLTEIPFDPTLKKKKKTPITTPVLEEGSLDKAGAEKEEEFSLSAGTKRKKAPKKEVPPQILAEDDPTSTLLPPGAKEEEKIEDTEKVTGAEHDHLYRTLLDRFTTKFGSEHPDSDFTIVIPTPLIGREGKKTIWSNFGETATILGRTDEHFSSYVFAELSANGSIDAKRQLIFKAGKYSPASLENVTKKYYATYVRCKSCNKSKTHLTKINRMDFVVCDCCGSKRHVEAISRGYEAQFKRKKN